MYRMILDIKLRAETLAHVQMKHNDNKDDNKPPALSLRRIGANQGISPQVRARGVYERVPALEVGHGDAVLLCNDIARVARNNKVEAAAVRHNVGHGCGGAGNADTGVVVKPKIVAACTKRK